MTSRQEATISANADTLVPSLACKPTQRGEKQLQIPLLLTHCARVAHALDGHYHSYQESSQQLLSQRLQELMRRKLLILTIVCLDTVFATGRHHVTQAAARQIARFILYNLYIVHIGVGLEPDGCTDCLEETFCQSAVSQGLNWQSTSLP